MKNNTPLVYAGNTKENDMNTNILLPATHINIQNQLVILRVPADEGLYVFNTKLKAVE